MVSIRTDIISFNNNYERHIKHLSLTEFLETFKSKYIYSMLTYEIKMNMSYELKNYNDLYGYDLKIRYLENGHIELYNIPTELDIRRKKINKILNKWGNH